MHTYTDRLNKVTLLLNTWRRRNFTWIGKITVLNTLCISSLNYALTTVETPEWFIRQIKDLFETFLWNNKPARIKNRVMYTYYDNGGLRMVNIDLYSIAQKNNWVKLLLNNKETVPYAYINMFLNMPLE